MISLTVTVFACLFVIASARPSGIWGLGLGHGPIVGASGVVSAVGAAGPAGIVTGHGAIGPTGVASAHGGWIGGWGAHDDGQWHGEGLLESQDWAGAHGGILAHGLGLGLGHLHW